MLERFVSTASRDFINYNNADYDALFAQAQACYDDGEQTALYRAMEKNLAENAATSIFRTWQTSWQCGMVLRAPPSTPSMFWIFPLSTIRNK